MQSQNCFGKKIRKRELKEKMTENYSNNPEL